ncbi:MAG TPA: FAD-binding oxidoreductase [Thermoanaerobaculia bacterium]|nr:FAD-binding oxidoreductase [Thermoanaerobaculia bacterium]
MTLPASRPAAAEDAVLGVRPGAVCEPGTVTEAAAVVGESSRGGRSVVFAGGGTDLDLGARPESVDVLVRTRRLNRIVEHAPSDQIVIAEAGVTLDALARLLAPAGQRLALDPPLPERATVGGVVAANAFGPRRARYGSVRDLLIGISIVRADGVLARGGGKVVKNVAGFDLPKLMVGSLGTLGLIATATFRLHPLGERAATLFSSGLKARDVAALGGRLREAQLEPDSVVAFRTGTDRFDLAVRFEGFARGVEEQCERFATLVARDVGAACDRLDQRAAGELWGRHDAARRAGAFRAKVAALPASLEAVEAGVLAPLAGALGSPACLCYPTLGFAFVGGEPADASGVAAAVAAARSGLAAAGGSLVIAAAPEPVRAAADVWGPPPAAVALMRGVKARLDPQRRLAPGRFVGGI